MNYIHYSSEKIDKNVAKSDDGKLLAWERNLDSRIEELRTEAMFLFDERDQVRNERFRREREGQDASL